MSVCVEGGGERIEMSEQCDGITIDHVNAELNHLIE